MALPDWLNPLPDAAQQRELDAWAIAHHGIPSEILMERAGTALAVAAEELVPGGTIAILCGRGNNGGDGLVAARVLRERGRNVEVFEVHGDRAAPSPAALAGAAGIVDALLGTGFSGTPREPISDAIEAINQATADDPEIRVLACDVPSGVDASTGEVSAQAVRADVTVTFHAAKPGLWISPGKRYAGRVRVVDIGIPSKDQPIDPEIGRISPAARDEVPRRGSHSNKFTAGSVLVCGGSRGLTGAPVMAAMAATRAGAGYVTLAVPASVASSVAGRLLEVMTVELPDDEATGLKRGTSRLAVERAARSGALVLGPGLGRQPASINFARAVASYATVPLVLDADGLNAHVDEGGLAALLKRRAPSVLTPHTGELARLLDLETAEVEAQRLSCARSAALRSGAVVVLKGDDTLVAHPDGRVAVSPGDAPALATAGTGDVLAGIVGAFLAKGVEPFTAACAAVIVHVKAGRIAARDVGDEGVVAGDVISAIPRALTRPQGSGRRR